MDHPQTMPLRYKTYWSLMLPVAYDDPFPDQPSRALDIHAFQLSQHLKGKWCNSLQKARASDPLFDIVSKSPNHSSWILIDRLLLKRGEDDS